MFQLLPLRNIIFLEMRKSDPKLKAAIGKILNELDSDLNVQGYAPSSDLTNAMDELDQVIIDLDSPKDITPIDNLPEEDSTKPTKGFRDLGDSKE